MRVGRGKHTALREFCHHVYHDQEPEPPGPYDKVIECPFWENYNGYSDRPNTKITNMLEELLGIPYDPKLGRYLLSVSPEAMHKADKYFSSIGGTVGTHGRYNVVICHYEGNTSAVKKNLFHWQGEQIIQAVKAAGRIPVVFDWDCRCPYVDQTTVFCPRASANDIWGSFGSGDAEVIAALIRWSEAYIGVDSGPGKVASTTETPTLICWRGHHPIQFHDPAPNTTHLVPDHHERLPPCGDHPGLADYFKEHYLYKTYSGDHGLVAGVHRWLFNTLGIRSEVVRVQAPTFLLPTGIGDSIWAMLKIQAIAADRDVHIALSGNPIDPIQRRAVPFLERFKFVRSVKVLDIPILHNPDDPADSRGRYNYVSDGLRDGFHYLIPNRTLESGRRIEEWFPEYPCNWNIMDEFSWENTERGEREAEAQGKFVAFYLGPEAGNTNEGHNRDWLWEPRHWLELALSFKERGCNLVVVGAKYDRSFWERYVRTGFEERGIRAHDLIGELEIGETFALLRRAKFFLSYQSGLGIVAHYLGVPTGMWWRPEGNSIHPDRHISFSEMMKDSWTNPAYQDRYLGLVYKRQTPGDVLAEVDRKGWLDGY